MLTSAGFSYVRTDMLWSQVERKPGEYNFTHWDALFDMLAAHNVGILVILNGYNQTLYAAGLAPNSDVSRAAFASFASAATRRYAGDRGQMMPRLAWELWNEPEGSWL
eukprot:SAG11_NODE_28239_length_324_cov_0.595556_1_plen_107_part_11